MIAFGALKKARFRLVCSPCLLGPEIGDAIAAFLAAGPHFWVRFDLFDHFNLLPALYGLFELRASFFFGLFSKPAGAVQHALGSFILGPQDRPAFGAKHTWAGLMGGLYSFV